MLKSTTLGWIGLLSVLAIILEGQLVAFSQDGTRKMGDFVICELECVPNTYALAFTRDGRFLLSGGNEQENSKYVVRRWEVQKRICDAKTATDLASQIKKLACSQLSDIFAASDVLSGNVAVFKIDGTKLNEFKHFGNGDANNRWLSFFGDGDLFAACSAKIAHKWNVATNRTLTYLIEIDGRAGAVLESFTATNSGSNCASCQNGVITFYKDRMAKNEGSFKLPTTDYVDLLALTEDGKTLMAAGYGANLYLVDVVHKKLIKSWKGHPGGGVFCMLTLPQLNAFITSDSLGNIKIWDDKGELIVSVRKYEHLVCALAANNDGTILASAGELQKSIILWDIKKLLGGNKRPGPVFDSK
jgi:WD40 repeat protein